MRIGERKTDGEINGERKDELKREESNEKNEEGTRRICKSNFSPAVTWRLGAEFSRHNMSVGPHINNNGGKTGKPTSQPTKETN